MFICELCQEEFLTQAELDTHMGKAIERAKIKGGKFALLARILEGDESALTEMEELIKAGLIGPEFDRTPGKN